MNWWAGWRRWWSRLGGSQRFGVTLAAVFAVKLVVALGLAHRESSTTSASAESSSAEPPRSAEGTTGYQAGYRVASSYPEEDCDYAADLMMNAAGGVESAADADFLRDYMQGCEAWHDDND